MGRFSTTTRNGIVCCMTSKQSTDLKLLYNYNSLDLLRQQKFSDVLYLHSYMNYLRFENQHKLKNG